jgi:recombination protein RecT
MSKEIAVLNDVNNVKALMINMKGQLENALPQHIKPEKFMRIALTEIHKNKMLLECTKESFFGALLTAAQEGLQIGSVAGESWLIPYYNNDRKCREAQYQRGYKGLYKLALNSGKFKSIDVGIIYENDPKPEARKGSDFCFNFSPDYMSDDRGKPAAYYCYTELISGEKDFDIMTVKQVELHRQKFSKQPNSPAWQNNFDAMAKKTVFIDHMTFKPKSSELSQALSSEEKVVNFDFELGDNIVDDSEFKEKKLNLNEKLNQQEQTQNASEPEEKYF